MPNHIEGTRDGAGLRIAVLLSRFNSVIGDRLLEGALGALRKHGVAEEDIDVLRVPGALEIPAVAHRLVVDGRHDAVVCLGAVVRGETPHFDFVAAEAARGVMAAATAGSRAVPVLFGVLTTDDMAQAMERSGGGHGNKGEEAAVGAIEMANLHRRLDS